MRADDLLARKLPGSVGGVLALMHELEEALPARDGVRFFLRLYRGVTEDVHAIVGPAGEGAQDNARVRLGQRPAPGMGRTRPRRSAST